MGILQTARNKMKEWLYIEPDVNQLKRDIEHFKKNQSSVIFQKKYSEKDRTGNYKTKESMNATIRRTYNTLLKSPILLDKKRGQNIKDGYDLSKTGIISTPKPPTPPPIKHNWFKFFNRENPTFHDEYIVGKPSTKAEVCYYYDVQTLLSDFVKNGLFYKRKIPILTSKLTNFFNGVRYYKSSSNKAVKVILFFEDVVERKVGKTFISLTHFNNTWIRWLTSLRVRYQLNDGNYEISYQETFLKYIRVSTYMSSLKFSTEKGVRFSLKLGYK